MQDFSFECQIMEHDLCLGCATCHCHASQNEQESKMSVTEEVVQEESSDEKIKNLIDKVVELQTRLEEEKNSAQAVRSSYATTHLEFKRRVETEFKDLLDSGEISRETANSSLENLGLERITISKRVYVTFQVEICASFDGDDDEMDTDQLAYAIRVEEESYSVPEGWEISSIDIDSAEVTSSEDQ